MGPSSAQLHFHIKWSSWDNLDWQCFSSRLEANSLAAHLVQPGETFTIEECSEDCLGKLLRDQKTKARSTAA
jgi:hypothetical protein